MLYIGIPAYNEATTIGVLLWRLRSVLAEVSREYEVVVYDDASTDQTADTLAPYSRVLPLTVIRGTQRLGYAGATDALVRHVARTTRYPRRDALLLLQGDFTDPPALVPEFLRRFEGGADLVIGERVSSGDAPKSVRRLWQASRWVLRPFVGISDVRDLTTSFRLVRIAVLRDLIKAAGDTPIVSGDAWSANADFLLRTAPHARRVETIPVTPTFTVRTRETRRTAWPDAIALAKWGWSRRGQRVAAKVIARAVEVVETDEPTAPDVVERPARERSPRERPARERATHDRATNDRATNERATNERPTRERPPRDRQPRERVARDEGAPRVESALLAPITTDAESVANATDSDAAPRPARKRRKRGARKDRSAPPRNGGDDAETGGQLDAANAERSQPQNTGREDGDDAGNDDASDGPTALSAEATGDAPARRKRSRRGRRRRGEGRSTNGADAAEGADDSDTGAEPDQPRQGRSRTADSNSDAGSTDEGSAEAGDGEVTAGDADEAARKRRRSRRGRRGGSRKRTNGSPGEGEPREGGSDAGRRDEGAGGSSEGA